MIFITEKKLRTGLDGLYGRVIAYVKDELLRPFSEEDQRLKETVNDLEKRLQQASAANTTVQETVKGLSGQLDRYEKRLRGLEESQQRTGIVSEVVRPTGEVTFEQVKSLAREVSDTAYERIRNYFLLEMAKKGYENQRPDFSIFDNDSYVGLQFLVTDQRQTPHAGWDARTERKTSAYIENMPELQEATAPSGKEKVLFSTTAFDNGRDYFLLSVRDNRRSDWAGKLREELPQMLQAYMLGYSLKCLGERQFGTALEVQKKHGLKDNSALLGRMSEIMRGDPNLASQFVTHYCPSV